VSEGVKKKEVGVQCESSTYGEDGEDGENTSQCEEDTVKNVISQCKHFTRVLTLVHTEFKLNLII
jgi:hypothetical protein